MEKKFQTSEHSKSLIQHPLFGGASEMLLLYRQITVDSISMSSVKLVTITEHESTTITIKRHVGNGLTGGEVSAPEEIAASASRNTLFQSPILLASVNLLKCFSTPCNFCSSMGSGWSPCKHMCLLAFSICPKL